MNLFVLIEDAVAIVRYPKGIMKQTKMYQRGESVYIPHGGGFVRLVHQFDEKFTTSHPDLSVIEFEAEGVEIHNRVPKMKETT